MLDRAPIHILRCRVDPAVAWDERINRRAAEVPVRRLVHGDSSLDAPFASFVAKLAAFAPVVLAVPTIEIDTSVGLYPVSRRSRPRRPGPKIRGADGSPPAEPDFRQ